MKPAKKFLGIGALLVLITACTTASYFKTSGRLKILASEPPLEHCTLRPGDYFLLIGNDFGTVEDWENGKNYLILPVELRAPAELTKVSDPATLQARVPEGAVSGTALLHVEGVGDATFEVKIENGINPSMALPECQLPSPSGSN